MTALQNIMRMFKSRRMRRVGHISVRSCKRNAYRTLVEIPQGKNHSEDPDVDGQIILKLILQELNGMVWMKFIGLRIGSDNGLL